jgi:hypothetical protein
LTGACDGTGHLGWSQRVMPEEGRYAGLRV